MTVEELSREYCSKGRFDLAFEVEHHDELQNLVLDWLVRDKITEREARSIFIDLRSKWCSHRQIDPVVLVAVADRRSLGAA